MSRILCLATAAMLTAGLAFAAAAPEPARNHPGVALAPNGKNQNLQQWGGIDDKFAVNPDGDTEAMQSSSRAKSDAANDGSPEDGDDSAEIDRETEVLPI